MVKCPRCKNDRQASDFILGNKICYFCQKQRALLFKAGYKEDPDSDRALCHPEQPLCAKGKCFRCYHRDYKRNRKLREAVIVR